MKNLLIVLMVALTSTFAYGQRIYNAPQIFGGTLQMNGTLSVLGGMYQSSFRAYSTESTSARKYTILGTAPLVVTSANFTNDTLNLLKTNYVAGQIISIITTAPLNDTLTITHDGNFAGATAAALISPATSASYKNVGIYFDGTNYWKL